MKATYFADQCDFYLWITKDEVLQLQAGDSLEGSISYKNGEGKETKAVPLKVSSSSLFSPSKLKFYEKKPHKHVGTSPNFFMVEDEEKVAITICDEGTDEVWQAITSKAGLTERFGAMMTLKVSLEEVITS